MNNFALRPMTNIKTMKKKKNNCNIKIVFLPLPTQITRDGQFHILKDRQVNWEIVWLEWLGYFSVEMYFKQSFVILSLFGKSMQMGDPQ